MCVGLIFLLSVLALSFVSAVEVCQTFSASSVGTQCSDVSPCHSTYAQTYHNLGYGYGGCAKSGCDKGSCVYELDKTCPAGQYPKAIGTTPVTSPTCEPFQTTCCPTNVSGDCARQMGVVEGSTIKLFCRHHSGISNKWQWQCCSNIVDNDNDGYNATGSGPVDCNDNNPNINPGKPEICGNSIDENCNGNGDDVCPISLVACSSPSQTILKLSSATNAHGEIWTKTNYPISICYDTIFGQAYAGTSSHSCMGSNKVLGLSDVTNAHAEIPSLDDYDTDVCYGDLICRNTTGSCNTGAGEKLIVSLSSATNAHLSNGTDYGVKICCNSGVELLEPHWENMNNISISEANLSALVKLVVGGDNLEGKNIEYEIWKDVAWWFDSKITQSSSTGFTTWRAGLGEDDVLTEGDYYFKATIDGGSEIDSSNSVDYGILTVSGNGNNDPVANITGPEDRQIYFKDEVLTFLQNSFDTDDEFNWTWKSDDVEINSGNSEDMSDFTYSFSEAGHKKIVLELIDDRGKTARDEINILVVNSKFVLPYISTPRWGSTLTNFMITFEGNKSYAVDFNHATCVINCLGGFCPSTTAGCASGCPPGITDCHLTVQNAPVSIGDSNYSNLNFEWGFDDGITYSGVGNISVIHNFDDWTDLNHQAYLNVSLVGGSA